MPYLPIHADYLASTNTGLHQDIKEFLMKPLVVQSGNLTLTDTSTTFALLEVLSCHANTTVALCKVNGFLGLKATHVFRLQINANRFQQGRYIMFWLPFGGGGNSGGTATSERTLRRTNLTAITQLPHVEIDINTNTEAILEVPYVSVFPYWSLKASTGFNHCLGWVGLCPYIPVATNGGSTTVPYTIYSHLKDVDLVAPTVPQMSFKRVQSTTQQIGRVLSGDPTEVEQNQLSSGGPISGAMNNVKKIADSAMAIFPSLSAIAAPVSWFANIAGGIASVFGWSNPIELSEVTRCVQTIQPWANNCDMPDASMPISLFARNHVEILPGFAGNDIDEMAIDYVKMIPAYYQDFIQTTGNASGALLIGLPFNLSDFYTSFVDTGPHTIFVNTPVGFVAKLFQLWRGSIVFRFKIVKTEFHSGRIEVVFYPQEPSGANGTAPGTSSATDRAFLHREIIDLREGNEFELQIPYTSIVPWRQLQDTIGYIQVYVVNPLIAPATVPNSIRYIVEVSGGEDLMFAVPRKHSMQPIVVTAPQMGKVFRKTANGIVSDTIGNSSLKNHSYLEARATIGEQVLSLSQLLKHQDKWFTATTSGGFPNIACDPFSIAFAYNNAGTIVNPPTGELSDNFALIASCYCFNRGGMRIRTAPAASLTATMAPVITSMAYSINGTADYTGFGTTTTPDTSKTLLLYQNEVYRGGAEIQVPQYSQVHSRIAYAMRYYSDGTVAKIHPTISNVGPTLNITTETVGQVYVNRQVSDDFQMGFWLGVPSTLNE